MEPKPTWPRAAFSSVFTLGTLCALSLCWGGCRFFADDDTPAQAAARAALSKKMQHAEAGVTNSITAKAAPLAAAPLTPQTPAPRMFVPANTISTVKEPTNQPAAIISADSDTPAQAVARAALFQKMQQTETGITNSINTKAGPLAAAPAPLPPPVRGPIPPPKVATKEPVATLYTDGDTPAQAAARAALLKKMQQPTAGGTNFSKADPTPGTVALAPSPSPAPRVPVPVKTIPAVRVAANQPAATIFTGGDTPAQAAARAALWKRMQEVDASMTNSPSPAPASWAVVPRPLPPPTARIPVLARSITVPRAATLQSAAFSYVRDDTRAQAAARAALVQRMLQADPAMTNSLHAKPAPLAVTGVPLPPAGAPATLLAAAIPIPTAATSQPAAISAPPPPATVTTPLAAPVPQSRPPAAFEQQPVTTQPSSGAVPAPVAAGTDAGAVVASEVEYQALVESVDSIIMGTRPDEHMRIFAELGGARNGEPDSHPGGDAEGLAGRVSQADEGGAQRWAIKE